MALFAITASAQTTFNDGTFKYELTTLSTTGETVAKITSWYAMPTGSNVTVNVPGYVNYNGTRYRVYEIGIMGLAANDNSPNTNIRSIVVGYGVQRINNYAFRSLSNLYMVQLPSSVNYLGYDLFYNNSVLTYVLYAGESVPTIGSGTFSSGASSKICSTATYRGMNALKADSKWNAAFSTIARHRGFMSSDFKVYNSTNGCWQYYTIKNGIPYDGNSSNPSVRSMCTLVAATFTDGSNNTISLPQSVGNSDNNSPGTYKFYGVADSAFMNNTAITQVVNNSTMGYRIGVRSFYGCTGLESADVPVDTIGDYAFYNCTNLYSVNLASSLCNVAYLGSYAFGRCNLSDVTIPQTTKYIGYAPFYNNSLMTGITVNANNPNYCSYYNALYNKSKTMLYQLPGNWQENVFPETLQQVYQYAAAGCKFSSLYLPYNLKILEQYAFQNCKNLKLVHFPSSVTTVNANAFAGCDAINRVEFNTMTPPAGDLFPAVTDKSSVDLYMPYGSYDAYANSSIWSQYNRKTGDDDHRNCWDIVSGKLYYTVTSTSPYSYNGYSGDGTLSVVKINKDVFNTTSIPSNQPYAGKSYVPTEIGAWAGSNIKVTFVISQAPSIRFIRESAFYSSWLATFPFYNVETIGDRAFFNTLDLTVQLTGLDRLKTIGYAAFRESNITKFVASTTLTSIGNDAFLGCQNLHEIFLPHIDGKHPLTCGNFFGQNASDFKCWVDYRRLSDFAAYGNKVFPHLLLDSEWQSFACVKDIKFQGISGLDAYVVSEYNQNNKKATLSKVTNLTYGNGAVVHGEVGTYYRLDYGTGSTSSWMVVVTGSSQTVNSNSTTSYFKLNTNKPQFDKITTSTSFNRGYAYLKVPTSQTGGATTIYTNLSGTGGIPGDVNGDGIVTAADVTALYDYLLNNDTTHLVNGDQTGDNNITAADVTAVYTVLLNN